MRNSVLTVIMLLLVVPAWAQRRKKKDKEEKVPVYNYVIDDPMDKFGRQQYSVPVRNFYLLPEFFNFMQQRLGDTIIRYDAYDIDSKKLGVDTLKDYTRLRYLSKVYQYVDHVNKYKDSNGVWQPLPIERIMYRYDKAGTDLWMTVDYHTNKSETVREYPNQITKSDSVVITDPVTGGEFMNVYMYYKVAPIK